jgi:urea transport system permease protein
VRLAAARELQSNVGAEMAEILGRAKAQESDAQIKSLLTLAHAQATLQDADPAVRLAAVRALAETASPAVKSLLLPLTDKATEADAGVRNAAIVALKEPSSAVWPGAKTWPHLLRPVARLHPAARRARPGHHLRRHGHHQHGARRIADGRRLHRLRHAEPVPHALPRTLIDWYLPAAIPVAFFTAARSAC